MYVDPSGHDWDWNTFWKGVGYLISGIGAIVGGTAGVLIGLGLEWLSEKIKEWLF